MDNRQVVGGYQGKLQGMWYGGGGQCEGINIDFDIVEFFFGCYFKFLFFVDDEQAKVFEVNFFIQNGVGIDDNINFFVFQLLENGIFFFSSLEVVDIIYCYFKFFQLFFESMVMLQGEDCCRNEYCYLFVIDYCFKGIVDSYFGFVKIYIVVYEVVYGVVFYYVFFYVIGGFELIGCIFVDEGGFQFILQVIIVWESNFIGGFVFGVEFNQFVGYIFDFFFGVVFKVFLGI